MQLLAIRLTAIIQLWLLIEKEIDINQTNKSGKNAFHFASEKGHKDIVQLLIEKGFDLNQTDTPGHKSFL